MAYIEKYSGDVFCETGLSAFFAGYGYLVADNQLPADENRRAGTQYVPTGTRHHPTVMVGTRSAPYLTRLEDPILSNCSENKWGSIVIYKTIWFLVLLATLAAAESKAASFDCAKASTRSERLICSDRKLQELDEKVTVAYRTAYSAASDKQGLKAEQFEWLKQRDVCETSDCIAEAYQSRIYALKKAKPDYSWLKEYTGKSTNTLVWDKRFGTFIKSISPIAQHDFGLGEQNLAGALSEALGGPPDKVIVADGRYLTFSACVYHFCPEKGFVWVDLMQSTAVAAIIHYDSREENFESSPVLLVFSRNVEASALPQRFKADLEVWLMQADMGSEIATFFIDETGNSAKL